MQKFQMNVLDPVNKENKKRGQTASFPRYAFWMPVGTNLSDQGVPIFTVVGPDEKHQTAITPPVLVGIGEKMPLEAIRALYVGRELMIELMRLYKETTDWAQAWDDVSPSDSDYEAAEPDEADLISEDDTTVPEQGSLVDRF
jgi:hypothetical protein